MNVLGITGCICSGKSAISLMFERCGAMRIDVDKVGHAMLDHPEVVTMLHDRWGARILDSHGRISRRAIADIVFAPIKNEGRELDFLQSIVHPRIAEAVCMTIEEAKLRRKKVVALDAPLLLEAGWDRMCDLVVFADCPETVRLTRSRLRGWSDVEYQCRVDRQLPAEVKRARADVVFDTSLPVEQTEIAVRDLWDRLIAEQGDGR